MRRSLSAIAILGTLFLGTLSPGAMTAHAAEFAGRNFGFSMTYPDGWLLSVPEPFTVVLGPADSPVAGLVTVAVQNITVPETEPADTSAQTLAAAYLSQIKGLASGVRIHRDAPFDWAVKQAPAGRQVVADLTQDGLPLRQWMIFQRSPFGPVVHIWLYTAPQSSFDTYLPQARSIVDTLRPEKPAPPPRN